MKKSILLPCLFILFACGSEESAFDPQAEIAAITEVSKNRADAFNVGDPAVIASYFTEDGILMAPGKPATSGRKAVEEYYSGIFEQYETKLESYYEEVEVSGDLGYGRGEARVTLIDKESGDTTFASSKYLNILQRQSDGSWKTSHDIWNDN